MIYSCSLPFRHRLHGGGLTTLASFAGLKLSKNLRPSPLLQPLCDRGENGCKITAFSFTRKRFRNFFSKNFIFFCRTLAVSHLRKRKSEEMEETNGKRTPEDVLSFQKQGVLPSFYSTVRSTTGASGAFFTTEATPLSMFFSLAYIWLEPMI